MRGIEYDEFGFFHENAGEYGLPYDVPPRVHRQSVVVEGDRQLSALVWGSGAAQLVLLHGGSQNAHTWDTVAMALDRPLLALDLPGHGHSDGPGDHGDGGLTAQGNSEDVAAAIQALAPDAQAVIGMSLGGLTTIALTRVAPELVRRVVLVDITPGVTPAKAKQITDFTNGPPSFESLDQLLQRTIEFNPTRSVASLRRGILHNAVQREDGTWMWRWARWRDGGTGSSLRSAGRGQAPEARGEVPMFEDLWPVVEQIEVPVLLARGMLPQSVLRDENESELLRRLPAAEIVYFDRAGHSIQGDMPVELARAIARFVFS